MGKIKNKYIIIDIFSYSIDDITHIFKLLHLSSKQMRNMLKKNYFLIKNMLNDTHLSFDAILKLTFNYKTSRAAHQRLEKILIIEYEKA